MKKGRHVQKCRVNKVLIECKKNATAAMQPKWGMIEIRIMLPVEYEKIWENTHSQCTAGEEFNFLRA